jgi:hypothetical protein
VLGLELIGAAAQRAAFLGQTRYLYFPCHQSSRVAPSGRRPQVTPECRADKCGCRGEHRHGTYQDACVHLNRCADTFLLCS